MPQILPHRFLFRFSFPVPYIAELPRKRGQLLDLPDECRLTGLAELDQAPRFADLRFGWNAAGLGCSVRVSGQRQSPRSAAVLPTEADGLQLWIDTRNTQSVHRATRFCHHFCLLPGSGKKGSGATALQIPIARAREEAPLAPTGSIRVAAEHSRDGYLLEAWFPAAALHGFDPDANPLLGFYYCVKDNELGDQCLTVGPEFPFANDPSLWSTLELRR